MTADFLLELLSEEIPARMQAGARNDLARLFADELEKAGLSSEAIDVFSTPRRLALIARAVPLETEARSEEIKGPRTSAPQQALDGFLRKTGLKREQLEERDGVYFARVETAGQRTLDLLGPMIERIVRAFPWPKSMRWGQASASTASLRWVRPLHGIVAMLGEDIVPVSIDGIESGATTFGHRFHHPGPITVGGAGDYAEKLRACHVIVDQDERERIIRTGAAKAARDAGLALVEDEGLVVENAGLTEWPVPLLGRFEADYLDVPREVIVLTMRSNQKYFACSDSPPPASGRGSGGGPDTAEKPTPSPSREREGNLAPAFVCIANIDANDGGHAIVDGNRRVLAARLADARFFWEQDLKVPLEVQAKKLSGIVFHEKLGTVADRVNRIVTVASERLPELVGWKEPKARQLQPLLREAAELAKADLVSGMVAEFPELQGTMGGYYAEGRGAEISEAIRDQYKPTGPSDSLPSGEVGTLLALADKADALYGFFLRNLKPTGSKDPFALRRAALGLIRLIVENDLRISLRELFSAVDWERLYSSESGVDYADPSEELVSFIIERLKVQQREAGVRHELIDAVFSLGGEDDLVRLLARVRALQEFVGTEDGADLLTAYKRASNILKKEKWPPEERRPELGSGPISSSAQGSPEWMLKQVQHDGFASEEAALVKALDKAEPKASAAVEKEDFTAAMAALASLRKPIDDFFDHVTVNDPDEAKRARRLNLLARFRDAVHRVADFSKIEG